MAGCKKKKQRPPSSPLSNGQSACCAKPTCLTHYHSDGLCDGTALVVVVVMLWLCLTACRVIYVTDPNNWWTLHPDEIFQGMEVAHTQVYGYGFRPYEFSTVGESDVEGGPGKMSSYRQREVELGMHAMRSALYPRFYVMVSYLAAIFGLNVIPYVLWKVAHAAVSSLLPLSVFRFASTYFRCRLVGCLAAILVTTSAHLNVLGTHPLLNSFLSPAAFWALSALIPILQGPTVQLLASQAIDDTHSPTNGIGKTHSSGDETSAYVSQTDGNDVGKRREVDAMRTHGSGNELRVNNLDSCTNGGHRKRTNFTAERKASVHTPSKNGVKKRSGDLVTSHRETTLVKERQSQSRAEEGGHPGRSRTCSDSRMIVKTTRTFSAIQTNFGHFICGLVLSLCVYMRIDIALLTAITVLPLFRPRLAHFGGLVVCVSGAIAGLALGLVEDCVFYGQLVVSPGNWVRFNVFLNLAGNMFGRSSFSKYFVTVFGHGLALPSLGALHAIVFLYIIIKTLRRRFQEVRGHVESLVLDNHHSHNGGVQFEDKAIRPGARHQRGTKRPETSPGFRCSHSEEFVEALKPGVVLTISWVMLLLCYSVREHKELRFVHNVLVLVLTTSASFVVTLLTWLARKARPSRIKSLAGAIILMFAVDQWTYFPSSRDKSNASWAYQRLWDSHDVNACLAYVSSQSDVTGVFTDSNFHVTGGYSLLHHDVPLFTFLVHEFLEFDVSAKVTLNRSSGLDPDRNVSFVTMDRLTDFVSVQNVPYLVRLLIERKHYNYVIVARDRHFLAYGFQELFAHGTMRVMKRTLQSAEERQLDSLATRVPVGVNATVLKYEGDVLFRFHRFGLALQRYLAAFRLNSSHAQIYQSIAACKLKLDDQSEARRWIDACVDKFGQSECSKPLGITNINPERRLF